MASLVVGLPLVVDGRRLSSSELRSVFIIVPDKLII